MGVDPGLIFCNRGRLDGAGTPIEPTLAWRLRSAKATLTACAPCNQLRRDRPTWSDTTVGPATGKADRFPLEVESDRAMTPEGSVDQEKPLLLNPCKDDPEQFLTYSPGEGGLVAVAGNLRGRMPIEILGLNRKRLRDARKVHVDKFIRDLNELHAAPSGDAVSLKQKLAAWLLPNSPFAMACRVVWRDPALIGLDPIA